MFIAGAGLVAQMAIGSGPGRAATLLGIYFAGAGAGIVASGTTVPALLAAPVSTPGGSGG